MTSWLPDLTDRSGPRYLAIADCLADDVRLGRLAEGERLPTHRDLADSLGLTVGTVSRAYAEAERRGLLHGEVGRGTFVGGMAGGWELPSPGASDPAVVDLGLNLPLYAQDPDLGDALRTLSKRRDLHELLSYQPFAGSDRYRRAGAQWIARHGLDVDPANVIVTGGAQHAIAILLGTLCRAGDVVLTEPLTYPGLKSVARLLGPRDAAGGDGRRGAVARRARPRLPRGTRARAVLPADPAQPDHRDHERGAARRDRRGGAPARPADHRGRRARPARRRRRRPAGLPRARADVLHREHVEGGRGGLARRLRGGARRPRRARGGHRGGDAVGAAALDRRAGGDVDRRRDG